MKRSIIVGIIALAAVSCQKESCQVCTIEEFPTGASYTDTHCGTDKEKAQFEADLKNQCAQSEIDNPGYFYYCNCD